MMTDAKEDQKDFDQSIEKIMHRLNKAIKKKTGIRLSARDVEMLSLTYWAEDAQTYEIYKDDEDAK